LLTYRTSLGKFQEFANYARSAEISRIPEARAYQIKQRTREQYPGILKKAIKVSRQLEQQGNYSDVEKLYRIILDCQEQLKDWLPLYYEENISVLLASIYEGVSGAFSRAELLEKTINFMKPDECRLPATMDKLFVAYTDSCRELASLGTLEIKTPLLLAVEFGNPAVVSFILEKEEEKHYINIADMSGRTPISLAVAKNATEIVRILIDNGAMHKLDQPYSDGTPLEIATREDSFECFRLLFDLGVGTDKFLFAAIQHDRVRMVIWLLDQGVNIHTVTWDSKFDAELTPLGMAVSRKRPSLVILLLERGADITKAGYAFDRRYCLSALCCAAANRDTVMVNMLIACGAAINETASHRERILPLCNAISRGFTDVTILLLEKGANPNTLTSLMDVMIYPLLIACNRRSCDLSLVEKLLEMGAHVNGFYFQRPLLIACRRAHEHLVKLLLSKGADVNLLSEEPTGRFSALQAACKCGIDGIIKILLENGANVNLRGRGTVTPLQLACKRGSERVVEWLIEKGADVNADAGVHIHAQSRYTALQTATQSGNIRVVKILLQHGAKVHIGVLGHAVKIGSWEMVKLLLDSGADANEREHIDPPSSGETILDWVDQLVEYSPQQYHEIRLLLIRYGAKTRVQLGPVAIE